MIPKSGAEYAYFMATFGDWAAFIFSWAANLVLKPSIVAIIILACADYAVAPFYEGTTCGAPVIVVKLIAALFMCKLSLVYFFFEFLRGFCTPGPNF